MSKRITIELSIDEALVLEGMSARFAQENKLALRHAAKFVVMMLACVWRRAMKASLRELSHEHPI